MIIRTPIILVLSLVFAAGGSFPAISQQSVAQQSVAQQSVAQQSFYTVQPGDTLWNIAQRFLQDPVLSSELRSLNNITDPRNLRLGTELTIRDAWLKAKPHPVIVSELFGTAKLKRAAGDAIDLAKGMKIKSGDNLVSSKGASVILEFADGSILTVRENTNVKFDQINFQSASGMIDTKLRLEDGKIESAIIPYTNSKSRFEIHTRAATLGVRGTDFRAGISPDDGVFRSETLGGSVAVSSFGVERKVNEFFGTATEPNEPPIRPQALLPRPRIGPSVARWLGMPMPLTLSWPAVQKAASYRLRISRDAQFHDLVQNRIITDPSDVSIDLPDGKYHVAVRAIDQYGLEGLDRTAAVEVATQ